MEWVENDCSVKSQTLSKLYMLFVFQGYHRLNRYVGFGICVLSFALWPPLPKCIGSAPVQFRPHTAILNYIECLDIDKAQNIFFRIFIISFLVGCYARAYIPCNGLATTRSKLNLSRRLSQQWFYRLVYVLSTVCLSLCCCCY